MISELSLVAAASMGFFGSGHCVAMCGGISCALTAGLPESVRRSPSRMLPFVIAYNVGRLTSYTLAGALFGMVGARAGVLLPPSWAHGAGIVISITFVIALGLYLGDWWRGLAAFERLGSKLWRYLQPLGRRYLPVTRWRGALAIGLLWGWLPCGLVYAALALALVSGGAVAGALTMLAFGLGTLPALISLGFAGRWLAALRHPGARRAAGASLCVLAVVLFLGAYSGHIPGHYHQHPPEKVGAMGAH
jgi:sulfite exporter TauE/SafE